MPSNQGVGYDMALSFTGPEVPQFSLYRSLVTLGSHGTIPERSTLVACGMVSPNTNMDEYTLYGEATNVPVIPVIRGNMGKDLYRDNDVVVYDEEVLELLDAVYKYAWDRFEMIEAPDAVLTGRSPFGVSGKYKADAFMFGLNGEHEYLWFMERMWAINGDKIQQEIEDTFMRGVTPRLQPVGLSVLHRNQTITRPGGQFVWETFQTIMRMTKSKMSLNKLRKYAMYFWLANHAGEEYHRGQDNYLPFKMRRDDHAALIAVELAAHAGTDKSIELEEIYDMSDIRDRVLAYMLGGRSLGFPEYCHRVTDQDGLILRKKEALYHFFLGLCAERMGGLTHEYNLVYQRGSHHEMKSHMEDYFQLPIEGTAPPINLLPATNSHDEGILIPGVIDLRKKTRLSFNVDLIREPTSVVTVDRGEITSGIELGKPAQILYNTTRDGRVMRVQPKRVPYLVLKRPALEGTDELPSAENKFFGTLQTLTDIGTTMYQGIEVSGMEKLHSITAFVAVRDVGDVIKVDVEDPETGETEEGTVAPTSLISRTRRVKSRQPDVGLGEKARDGHAKLGKANKDPDKKKLPDEDDSEEEASGDDEDILDKDI